jgi:putative membrane protein
VIELVIKILVNAAALWVAVRVLPPNLLSFDYGNDWWKLLAVALIFALVNSYIRPIVKTLAFPITILTLGLVSFIINAALLLLVAGLSGQFELGFTVGDFPPNLVSVDTIIGAIAGAVVISIVSTIVNIALAPRRLL